MKGLALSVTCLVLLILGGCARHFVVERDAGRVESERSITTSSDAEWTVRHEPAPGTDPGRGLRPHSASHSTVYRNVLLEGRAAPLRAEAAKQLGEHLADDKKSVLALSMATNDENLVVQQAARKALVRIFDARHHGREDEKETLEELGKVAQQQAYQLSRGAIDVIKWLWDNVYFWPA